jgi:hypothetical protein
LSLALCFLKHGIVFFKVLSIYLSFIYVCQTFLSIFRFRIYRNDQTDVVNVSEFSENDNCPSEPKKIIRSFTLNKKLEILDFARNKSIHEVSRKYNVDQKRV